jgi:short-subunit dehydrogenase
VTIELVRSRADTITSFIVHLVNIPYDIMSVEDRSRAIVTGAGSGIGKATALAFAKAGIDLALVGRNKPKLESVADAAAKTGVKVEVFLVDLARLESVASEIERIPNVFGEINTLVNNAGVGYTNMLGETSLKDWQNVINLNLTSVFQCVRGVLPSMRRQQKGTIINVGSIAACNFFPDWGAYSVSKAGLLAFSKVLALEEKQHGIRVITISPGAVDTPLWDTDTVKADFDRSAMLDPEIVAQTILHAAIMPAEAVIEELTLMPSAGAL